MTESLRQQLDGSNEPNNDEDTSDRGTFINFKPDEHTEAYNLAKGGGPLRTAFPGRNQLSIHDFYAMVTPALAEFGCNDNLVPLLKATEPTADELEEYIEANDVDCELVREDD